MVQYKKDDIRNRILQAATSLFITRGVEGARMSDIAHEAGISVGNLYRYFKDKEALLEELCPEAFVEGIKRKLSEIFKGAANQSREELFTDNGWLKLKEGFDDYLFLNHAAIMIAASHDKYYEEFKADLTYFLAAVVSEQFKSCGGFSSLHELALKMIYENLLDLTMEVFRKGLPEDERRRLLKIINNYHLNGILQMMRQ